MKTRLLAFIAPLALGAGAAWADGNSINSIQFMIGGVYTLTEWHIDGVATAPRLTPIGNDTNAIHDRSVARGADLVGPEGFEPSTKGL